MSYVIRNWLLKCYATFFMAIIAYMVVSPFFKYLEPFLDWDRWQSTYVSLQFSKIRFNAVLVSFKVSIIGTLVGCTVATLTAYALAVYEFRFKLTVMILLVIIMMIPFIVNVVPLFLTLKLAEQYLSFLTQVPVISFFTARSFSTLLPVLIPAFGVFVIKQYLESVLNKEMLEAARIEGAKEGRIFLRLVLPMLYPVIAIVALSQFAIIWNSYSISQFFVGDPIERGLAHTIVAGDAPFGPVTNGSLMLMNILVIVPIIILALLSRFILKFINADMISQE
ncbi:ABC transporter permease subunit [Marinicellulosiphila megalodicopiae]|uniref:ABC transporter permease subunit n=1 Tax=Marinicellulosiphila megalodicopiae TaxID=2724896 RepID=UPI003BB1C44D